MSLFSVVRRPAVALSMVFSYLRVKTSFVLLRPNPRRFYRKRPKGVMNAVRSQDTSAREIWWYSLRASNTTKCLTPFGRLRTVSHPVGCGLTGLTTYRLSFHAQADFGGSLLQDNHNWMKSRSCIGDLLNDVLLYKRVKLSLERGHIWACHRPAHAVQNWLCIFFLFDLRVW